MKIPLMILSLDKSYSLVYHLRGFGKRIGKIFPRLEKNIYESGMNVKSSDFVSKSFLSAVIWSFLFFGLILTLLTVVEVENNTSLKLSFLGAFFLFFVFFLVIMNYPGILAGKRAEQIEKDLVFALKDMLLELSSGASMYNALAYTVKSDYGIVSEEFSEVVKKTDAGEPIEDALEELALKTTSKYLKDSIWQVINAMRSGANIESTIKGIINDLMERQKGQIKKFGQELNVMVLVYMLFAVVIPMISITILIVMGPFIGLSFGPEIFYVLIPVVFFVQIAIVEFMKSRRPIVHL